MTTTEHVGVAAINAALWLREQVRERGAKSMSFAFKEAPITVVYTEGRALVSMPGQTVALTDDELESERWAVTA
jgi:hypothetical protein